MDKADSPRILSEAFRLYGSMIAQAFNVPPALTPLVTGEDAVVTVHLNKDQTISLVTYDVKQTKKQIKAWEETIKTQKKEVESLEAKVTVDEDTVKGEPETQLYLQNAKEAGAIVTEVEEEEKKTAKPRRKT